MGDRAQLQITNGTESFFLYTHWGGGKLAENLWTGLSKGRSCKEDVSYCLGMLLKVLTEDAGGTEEATGFGVGFKFADNDDERGAPLVLNIKDQTVMFKETVLPILEFIAAPGKLGWS